MDIVKLSNKGQVLIPKSIRDYLNLSAGAEFTVSITSTGLTLTRTVQPPLATKQIRSMLAKQGRALPSDAELKRRILKKLKASDDATKE